MWDESGGRWLCHCCFFGILEAGVEVFCGVVVEDDKFVVSDRDLNGRINGVDGGNNGGLFWAYRSICIGSSLHGCMLKK